MSSSVASEKLDDKAKAQDETPGTAETSSWAEESSPTSIEASQPASAKTDQPDSTPNAAAQPTSTDVDKVNNAPNEVQQTLPSADTDQTNSVSDGLQQSLPPVKLDQNNNVSDEAQPKLPVGKTVQDDGAPAMMGGSGQVIDSSHDVDVKLSDVQADPNDPLYSIKSFQELGLDELILKGIYQMRFTKPSKIQEKALPLLLSNPPANLIGQSQSGTGKTAAYVLNILARVDLKNPEMRGVPQALCLAPTRELARQIIGVIQMMGSFVENLNVLAAIPMEITNRKEKLHGQIVVGTPGTVLDLIRKRLLQANQIKVLVLDEADNMLDLQGMGDQCIRVKKLLPQTVQTVLFSATFPEKVVKYAANFAPNSNQITLRHEELTVKGIKQVCLDCRDEEHKFEVLVNLYGLMTIGSSIIFVNSRETAERIEKRMNREGHKVAQLTGKFAGSDRDDIIDSFRDGRAKVLIATNVLARGIDVQTVSLVVNYDVPYTVDHKPDPETYLHRIGRTGRFGRVGVSISLVHNPKSWHALKEIGDFFGVEPILLDTTDWDQVEIVVKKVIKSSRAGADFNMNEDE